MTDYKRKQQRRSPPPPTMAEMFFRNPVLYCYVWMTNKMAQILAERKRNKGERLDDFLDL